MTTEFTNPYTFVRTPPRSDLPEGMRDRVTPGHHTLAPGLWSGHLDLKLTALTPLLIPDHDAPSPDGVGVRRGPDGDPLVLGSSVRGMLRTAYEAVANSRMGAVDTRRWRQPLTVREKNGANKYLAVIVGGQAHLSSLATVPEGTVTSFAHHQEVWFEVEELRRQSGKRWVVLYRADRVAAEPFSVSAPERAVFRGVLRKVGKTFGNKKHEHVAALEWHDGSTDLAKAVMPFDAPFAIEDDVRTAYDAVMDSYRGSGDDTGSRRVITGPYVGRGAASGPYHDLSDGLVLFATVTDRGPNARLARLTPAATSRLAGSWTPLMAMHDLDLLPPSHWDAMSSADRLFGTVALSPETVEGGHAARGLVSVGAVHVEGSGGIERLRPPVALAPLSEPKPEQFRFYTGTREDQAPLRESGLDQHSAFGGQATIRGRKTYVTHQDRLEDRQYWSPEGPRGRQHDYVAHPDVARSQRIDVTEWIPIGTVLRVRIEVRNLHRHELAALAWLLHSGADERGRIHKLGLGRPLGFGAVAAALASWTVVPNEMHRRRWSGDENSRGAVDISPDDLMSEFERLAQEHRLPARDWHVASEGVAGPVHAPRLVTDDGPPAEGYEWFVQNAKRRPSPVPLPLPGGALPRLEDSKPRRSTDTRRADRHPHGTARPPSAGVPPPPATKRPRSGNMPRPRPGPPPGTPRPPGS